MILTNEPVTHQVEGELGNVQRNMHAEKQIRQKKKKSNPHNTCTINYYLYYPVLQQSNVPISSISLVTIQYELVVPLRLLRVVLVSFLVLVSFPL